MFTKTDSGEVMTKSGRRRRRGPGKSGSHVSDTGHEKRRKGIRNAMKRRRTGARRKLSRFITKTGMRK